jgi:hypothetical protein
MIGEWKTLIRCYVSPAGNNRIADWYSGLSAQEKADADEFLKNMRKTREWKMPNYRPRLVNGEGLGELRWESEGKQHRLLGFFADKCWYAVVGCTHKGQVYNPADALETAKKYKKQIEAKKVNTVEYDL